MTMNTTIAFGGSYPGSSERTTLFVVQPATTEAREPEPAVIRLPFLKDCLEETCARVPMPEPEIWDWLELGCVVVLTLSVLASVLLFLAAPESPEARLRIDERGNGNYATMALP
jgi:hypothetical protein